MSTITIPDLPTQLRTIYTTLTTNSTMNNHQLSLHTGLDITTLRKIRNGDPTITLRTLNKFILSLGGVLSFSVTTNPPQ